VTGLAIARRSRHYVHRTAPPLQSRESTYTNPHSSECHTTNQGPLSRSKIDESVLVGGAAYSTEHGSYPCANSKAKAEPFKNTPPTAFKADGL